MNVLAEFRRNAWMELSLHRLILMPVIIAAVLFVTSRIDFDLVQEAIAFAALIVYALLTLVWGTRLVLDSIVGEMKSKTWDFQRMSSLSPMAMLVGKLLGSTVYVWYGSVLALGAFAYFSLSFTPGDKLPVLLLQLIVGIVLLHAVALLVSVHASRKDRSGIFLRGSSILWLLGVMWLVPYILLLGTYIFDVAQWGNEGEWMTNTLDWYGRQYLQSHFILGSLCVYLLWALIGVYRVFAEELSHRTYPWAWVGFLVFITIYVNGFSDELASEAGGYVQAYLITGIVFGLASFYLFVISEIKQPVVFRRLLRSARERDWGMFFGKLPLWMVTLVLVFFVTCALLILSPTIDDYEFVPGIVTAAFLFAMRDLGVFLFFNFAKNHKRADLVAVVYLIILYALIPAIVAVLGIGWIGEGVWHLFYPTLNAVPKAIVSPLIQTAVVAALAWMRWKKLYSLGEQA